MPSQNFLFDLTSSSGYRTCIEQMRLGLGPGSGRGAIRTADVSNVDVRSSSGHKVTVHIRHFDLWTVGLDFGKGRYYFADQPAGQGSRTFEFKGSYHELGVGKNPQDRKDETRLSLWSLDSGVTRLAKHEVKANGSGMMAEEKRAIAYLVFALSEGLRFTNVENDIAQTIANGGELLVNGYGGDLVNKWETLSLAGDHRIAMAHTRPAE